MFGEAFLHPGDTERDLGLRYAEALRNLGPLAAPTLGHMLNLRLREQMREAVIGQAELQSGRLPGAQPVTVGFVDIVGFTQLGEEIAPEDLGAVVRDFERAVERVDAARAARQDDRRRRDARGARAEAGAGRCARPCRGVARRRRAPLLRGGVASGERAAARRRLVRAPGQPRLTAHLVRAPRHRRGVKDVHDAAADGYAWSFAGNRRFKGVDGRASPVYRVRPAEPEKD